MSDEAPKSDLARKALAQKAEREKAAAEAEAAITGAATRRQVLAEFWTVIATNYAASVQSINKELAGTGTALKLDNTGHGRSHLVGSLAVTVVRADDPRNMQWHRLTMGNSGRLYFEDDFQNGEREEKHEFDAEGAGYDWVQPTLRAFVDRALS